MKKITKLLFLLLAAVFMISCFAACDDEADTGKEVQEEGEKESGGAEHNDESANEEVTTVEITEAPEVTSEGLEFTSNKDGTCYVSGIGTCTDSHIIIPSVSPAGDTVIAIGKYSFSQAESITNVTIPSTVKSIGEYAFNKCTALTEIVIPDTVTELGADIFNSCSSLTKATLPDNLTVIPESMFEKCVLLGDFVFPSKTPPCVTATTTR